MYAGQPAQPSRTKGPCGLTGLDDPPPPARAGGASAPVHHPAPQQAHARCALLPCSFPPSIPNITMHLLLSAAAGARMDPRLWGAAGARMDPRLWGAAGAVEKTYGPVARARGIHPIPSRTRSLSPAARMVLPGRPGGRVRRRRPTQKRLPSCLQARGGALRAASNFRARVRREWWTVSAPASRAARR